jgi:hypothetical protein
MDDGAGRQQWGVNMMGKFPFAMIAAAALLAISVAQTAQAQSTTPSKPVGCNLAWSPIQVEVIKNSLGAEALRVSFDEIRLAPKYSGATLIWKLVGSPDYEVRVYKKGSPASSTPIVSNGTVVNAS